MGAHAPTSTPLSSSLTKMITLEKLKNEAIEAQNEMIEEEDHKEKEFQNIFAASMPVRNEGGFSLISVTRLPDFTPI